MPASFLRFDYKTLTLGRRLTNQALWCLGCDVRASGFPLTSLGWTYHSRPDKKKGCGRLTGMLPDGGHLSLWGFGFLAQDHPKFRCSALDPEEIPALWRRIAKTVRSMRESYTYAPGKRILKP
jgi:hypothetical protein